MVLDGRTPQSPEESRLLPEQRQLQVAALLAGLDAVALDDLARRFGVSAQTIRRDLARLERKGLVRRTHGGAVTRDALNLSEPAFLARQTEHSAAKTAIARLALGLLRSGESIYLDASTTVLALVGLLPQDWAGDVVVTSLPAAVEVSRLPGARLMVVGGEFRHSSRSFGGPLAEQMLEHMAVNTALISARAIHHRLGLMEAHAGEAALKRSILSRADRVIVLADGSKLGRVAVHRVTGVDRIEALITDCSAAPEELDEIRRVPCNVYVAETAAAAARSAP
jgi:DeoR/GlpR family transcriptional regulator of sugar metabolism